MVGLTPSAVSHHLRALEKWGIARRATGTGDGRERPWESTADSITLRPKGGASATAALHSVVRIKMDELTRRLDTFIESGSDPWTGAYRGLATGDRIGARGGTAARAALCSFVSGCFHRTGGKHAERTG